MNAHHFPQTRRRDSTLAAAVAIALMGTPVAHALPTDPVVEAGKAKIHSPAPNALAVQQTTDRAVIDWRSFSIGSGERVEFAQPSSSAIVLNRVLGMDPSQLLGDLKANGRVFLINPNGIVFGRNARVDVGGLVASTLSLSTEDFLADRFRFRAPGVVGAIRNEGQIEAGAGGIALIAPQITNTGSLSANGAQIGLIAADSVLVDVEGDGMMHFRVDAGSLSPRIEQLGRIQADGGGVTLQARARGAFADTVLNMEGVVRAHTIGAQGGSIVLDGGPSGITRVAGTLDTASTDATGGKVSVTGEKVLLDAGARIDASGLSNGGQILVGGGAHGTDASIANADQVFVAPGASLSASGGATGAGGRIVVWSERNTVVVGDLSTTGGRGGFIETSSAGTLDVRTAPVAGVGGAWLLDPYDITITSGGGSSNISASSPFTPSGTPSKIGVNLIDAALTGGASVTVTTGSSGSENGDITLSANLKYSNAGANSLTLNAARNIVLNGEISPTGSATQLNLVLQPGTSGSGEIQFQNPTINLGAGSFQASGAVNLMADTTLSASSASFAAVNGAHALSINTTGATGFSGAIGTGAALSTLSVTGGSVSATSGIKTTGAVALTGTSLSLGGIDAGGAVTLTGTTSLNGTYVTSNNAFSVVGTTSLAGNTTVSTGSGAISFGGTVDGNKTLQTTSTAGTTFSAAVGGATALSSLQVTGPVTAHGINSAGGISITGTATLSGGYNTTNSALSVTGATQLANDVFIVTGSGPVSFGGTIDGAHVFETTTSATTTLTGAVGGSTRPTNVIVNGPVTANGIKVAGTGVITLGGNAILGGDYVSGGGAFTANGATLLSADTTVTTGAGTIKFAGAVDGAHALSTSSTPGSTFSGAVGSVTPLSVLSVTGPVAAGAITTSGAISLSGASTLAGNITTTNAAFSATGDATLGTDVTLSTGSGSISFGGKINGAHALALTGSGNNTLSGTVGDATRLTALSSSGGTFSAAQTIKLSGPLSLSGSSVSLNGADTNGTLTITGPANLAGAYATANHGISVTGGTTLTGDVTIDAGTAALSFGAAVDGAHALGVTSSSGTTFSGPVGGTTALASLNVTGPATAGNVTTTGPMSFGGATTLGGNYATGGGDFSVSGPLTLAAGTNVSTGSGGITLGGTVDGAQALSLVSSGITRIDGAIGHTVPLSSLSTDVGGSTQIAVAGLTYPTQPTISTSGNQTFGDPVTLLQPTFLWSSAGIVSVGAVNASGNGFAVRDTTSSCDRISGGFSVGGTLPCLVLQGVSTFTTTAGVTFGGAVDGAFGLSVGGNFSKIFSGPVGAVTPLASLSTSGTGAVQINSVTTTGAIDLASPTQLSGTYVTAGGSFRVSGAASLNTDTSINTGGGSITFDSSIDGAHALTTTNTGATTFAGSIGGATPLTSVSASAAALSSVGVSAVGPVTFNAGVTTLSGTFSTANSGLTVSGATSLSGNTVIDTGSGAINFGGTVDGAAALSTTSSASTTFGAAVGSISRLSSLVVNGPVSIHNVGTTGLFSVSGATTLSGDASVVSSAGAVDFQGPVDGLHALSINATSGTHLGSPVGGSAAPTSVSISGGVNAGDIRTTGPIAISGASTLAGTYNTGGGTFSTTGPITLGSDTTVTTGTGAITLGGTVDGAHGLTLSSSGATRIEAAIGSATPLSSLTTDVGGATFIAVGGAIYPSSASITTSGNQTFNDPVTLEQPTFLNSIGGAVVFNAGFFAAGFGIATRNGASGCDGLAGTLAAGGTMPCISLLDTVVLNASAPVIFSGTINGAHTLAVTGNVDKTFNAAVGGTTPLVSFTSSGSGVTRLNSVTTTGAISVGGGATLAGGYNSGGGSFTVVGDASLSGDATIATGSGTIGFGGGVDGAHALTTSSFGTTTFTGAVGGMTPLASLTASGGTITANQPIAANGAVALSGSALTLAGVSAAGPVTISGPALLKGLYTTSDNALRFTEAVTLSGNTSVSTGAGAVNFVGTVDGPRSLSIASSAGTQFGAAIGATSALSSLSVSGPVQVGDASTSGSMSFGGAATLGGNYATAGGAFNVGGAATLSNNTSIATGGGSISFGDRIDGVHNLSLNTTGSTSLLGALGASSAPTTVSVSSGSFSANAVMTSSGPLTVSAATLAVAGITAGGPVTLNGATTLRGAYTTTDAAFEVNGAATLAGATTIGTGTGAIRFDATVDGAQTLNATSSSGTRFAAATGAVTPLAALTVSGPVQAQDINASGDINLGGPATLGGHYSSAAGTITAGGPVSLVADTSVNATHGAVIFAGAIDGAHTLSSSAASGTRVDGALGATTAPTGVSISGPASLGDVTSTGNIALNGAATLGGRYVTGGGGFSVSGSSTLARDVTLDTGSGAVSLGGAVDGAHTLTISNSATTTLGGLVGATAPLSAINVSTGNLVSSSRMNSSGAVSLGAGAITTRGITSGGAISLAGPASLSGLYQTSNGAFTTTGRTTLDGDTTVSTGTGTIHFSERIDGAHALVLTAAGGSRVDGVIGGDTALNGLTINGPGSLAGAHTHGAVTLNGATSMAGHYDTAGGNFAVNDATTLRQDTSIDAGAGAVSFASTVDGAQAFAVSSGTGTQFAGSVGSTAPLTQLTVTGPVSAVNVTTAGPVALNGPASLAGAYATNGGAFSVSGALTLRGDVSVRSDTGTIRLGGPVDGHQNLALSSSNGTVLNGLAGASSPISSLTISGPSALTGVHSTDSISLSGGVALGGDLVAGAGSVTISGPVSVTHDATISAGSATITGTVDGAHSITLSTSGTLRLSGAVGTSEAPTSITATSGRIEINAPRVTTRTSQTWNGPVWLGSDTAISSVDGGVIMFNGTVNSANASRLSVLTAGTTRFTAPLGGDGALGALTTDSTGSKGDATVLDFAASAGTPSIRTTGDINVADALESRGSLRLVAGGQIHANNAGNQLAQGGSAVSLEADSADLRTTGKLNLGDVHLAKGGQLAADGVVTLEGLLRLDGGALAIVSDVTPTVLGTYSDNALNEAIHRAGLTRYRYGSAVLPEYSAAIQQAAGSTIQTAAGSLLGLRANHGASINVESTTNTIHGGISAVSGTYTEPSRFDQTAASTPVGFIRLYSDELNVSGLPANASTQTAAGLLADSIKLTTARLRTGNDGLIKARMPYLDAQGVPTSLPGIVFNILPGGLASRGYGTPSASDWIRLQVGDGRQGGFVTLTPKGAFRPDFAVFAGGDATRIPFYDGTNVITEIQIYYNGALPQAANLVGALTAVSAVAEDARRQKIDEAVRTENVTRRLRAGVIAEVGPGRPATMDSEGSAHPDLCEPREYSLSCK